MKILITGASGLLGQRVMARLAPTHDLYEPAHDRYDLRDAADVTTVYQMFEPDAVIHLACPYGGGGIGYADKHPFTLASDMVKMDTLLIQGAVAHGVQTFLGVGSVCAYPEEPREFLYDKASMTYSPAYNRYYPTRNDSPVTEARLFEGHPEPINAPYGLAKRMQLTLLQAARKEHGLSGIHLILANLYGPGDKFTTGSRVGHVIPSTIMKCVKAIDEGRDEIVCWGDGTPTRAFLYVDDAADAIVRALTGYDAPEPINICDEHEVSIKDLATDIAQLTGFTGRITWDTSKPNGQMRRLFSNARARDALGWAPQVSYVDGLTRTVTWYREQRRP